MKLDKSKCLGSSVDTTRAALEKALHDPKFQIKHGYGNEVKRIAQEVLDKSHNNIQLESYANSLIDDVFSAIDSGDGAVTSAEQDLIWTEFHKIRSNHQIKSKWTSAVLKNMDKHTNKCICEGNKYLEKIDKTGFQKKVKKVCVRS